MKIALFAGTAIKSSVSRALLLNKMYVTWVHFITVGGSGDFYWARSAGDQFSLNVFHIGIFRQVLGLYSLSVQFSCCVTKILHVILSICYL